MFDKISGPRRRVTDIMAKEIERVYALAITRIVRNPTSQANVERLPVWISCPDFPVPKHAKLMLRHVLVNEGLHYHAVAVLPPGSRLRDPLDMHFMVEQSRYVRWPMREVHAVQLDPRDVEQVTDYLLKSLLRMRVSPDDILLLPRSLSEVTDRKSALN